MRTYRAHRWFKWVTLRAKNFTEARRQAEAIFGRPARELTIRPVYSRAERREWRRIEREARRCTLTAEQLERQFEMRLEDRLLS